MPYDYKKLSPEQRQAILQNRLEAGYPSHSPPHPFRQTGYYLITAANYLHEPIMANPERLSDFESRLIKSLGKVNTEIVGWVILPNHYHILIGVEVFNNISIALKQIHGASSREWNIADNQTGNRRVWYKFSDRMIRNEAHLYTALNYIHFNPVKHGYVKDAYDWPWASLIEYREEQGREWLREKWRVHPLHDFGKGWDD